MTLDFAKIKAAYKGSLVLHEDPMVAYIDEFLSKEECEHIICLAEGKLKRAQVSLGKKGTLSPGRSGKNCWLQHDEDETVTGIVSRISNLVGIPSKNAESIQVVHYSREQEYRAHFDAYNLTTAKGRRCCQFGGQRLVTALVYLNEVESGGSTAFPKLDLEVLPSLGRLTLFHNVESDKLTPHPLSLHAGTPVLSGQKWAFNIWFRARSIGEAQDFDSYPDSIYSKASGRDNPGIALTPSERSIQVGAGLALVVNRARPFIYSAAASVVGLVDAAQPVCFTYWDTFKEALPARQEPNQEQSRIIALVDRKISSQLANRKKLFEALQNAGLSNFAPEILLSKKEARQCSEQATGLWFFRDALGAEDDNYLSLPLHELIEKPLPKNHFMQREVAEPATIGKRPLKLKLFCTLYNKRLYLYSDGVISTRSVIKPEEYIHEKLAARPEFMTITEPAARLIHRIAPILSDCIKATDTDTYAILAMDMALDKDKNLYLTGISNMPNFHLGNAVETEVVVPYFEATLRTLLGETDDRLIFFSNA